MYHKLIGLFLVLSFTVRADYWIVGETYVGHWRSDEQVLHVEQATPKSWAFDADRCQVGIEEPNRWRIFSLDAVRTVRWSGRLLSDAAEGRVLVDNEGQLEERELLSGAIIRTSTYQQASTTVRATYDPTAPWLLNRDKDRLWVSLLDSELSERKERELSVDRDLWAQPKILKSPLGIWVGYTASSNAHAYTPYVTRLNADGNIEEVYRWNSRGIFFDFCADGDTVISSRDVPSAAFTLPIQSYLEKLVPFEKPAPIFAAEVNWFVDALACDPSFLALAERSIHSTARNRLRLHNRATREATVLALPGLVKAIYGCSR